VWNASAAAGIEYGVADRDSNDAIARISDLDQPAAAFKQPAHRPSDKNEGE
jgi:hypothetical protein